MRFGETVASGLNGGNTLEDLKQLANKCGMFERDLYG